MKSIVVSLMLLLHASAAVAQILADTAFVDVHVVPMDQDRVLRHQTVLVKGRFIAAVGPASTTQVPAGVQRVEGQGTAYLLPGLADMHTHVLDLDELPLYTVNGVTTILHMGDAPFRLVVGDANDASDRSDLVGPHIFFSLMLDGTPAIRGDERGAGFSVVDDDEIPF